MHMLLENVRTWIWDCWALLHHQLCDRAWDKGHLPQKNNRAKKKEALRKGQHRVRDVLPNILCHVSSLSLANLVVDIT